MRFISILTMLLLFGLFPTVVVAESTIACHCFKDRSFDHQQPGKVVPYLLATTQNSFLAVAFKTDKFQLVKALMGGTGSEQLWISNYFAASYGFDSKSLLSARTATGSWQEVLTGVGLAEASLSPSVRKTLSLDDQQLAAAIVDETLLKLLSVDAGQLAEIRATGAGNRETILVFYLAKRTGQEATKLYRSVTSGATGWGILANVNNVQIGKMQEEFEALLR